MNARHAPFALSMFPFFGVGMAVPFAAQALLRGRLRPDDGWAFLVALAIAGTWEWAILFSVKSKKRRSEDRLLGRELSSWYWAPPFTLAVGVVAGVIILYS
jgi:hypothetical protein